MELTSSSNPFTADGARQGFSYALAMERMTPLVVVTNGINSRFLETHSGNDWKPIGDSEAEFAKLIDAARRAAAVDIKQAVEVLLGTSADIRVSAVRQSSSTHQRPVRPMGQPALAVCSRFSRQRRFCPPVASLRPDCRRHVAMIAHVQGDPSHRTPAWTTIPVLT
jgi:hypothetical protein